MRANLSKLLPASKPVSPAALASYIGVYGLLGLCGCATKYLPPEVKALAAPSEEVRSNLGTVVVAGRLTNEITGFPKPMSKGRAAATGAGEGAVASVAGGTALGQAYGFVAGVMLSPVAGIGGAAYGTVAGMSFHEYQAISNTLNRAVQDIAPVRRLPSAVAESASLVTSNPVGCCTNFVSPTVNNSSDYGPLTHQGAQTVLELTTIQLTLSAPSGINPPLTLTWVVSARLLRITDNTELFTTQFAYSGETRTLRQWAADDARLFRIGLQQAQSALAGQIAENIFLLYCPLVPAASY
jgi:hypothetical protein